MWPAPGQYDKPEAKKHPKLGAPLDPLPQLMVGAGAGSATMVGRQKRNEQDDFSAHICGSCVTLQPHCNHVSCGLTVVLWYASVSVKIDAMPMVPRSACC